MAGGAALRAGRGRPGATGFRYHYSLFQADQRLAGLFTSRKRMAVFSTDRPGPGPAGPHREDPPDAGSVRGDTRGSRELRSWRSRSRHLPRSDDPAHPLQALTLKIYTKGERCSHRGHGVTMPRSGLSAWGAYFPEAVEVLRQIVDRFIEVLDCLDTTVIDAGLLDRLPQPGRASVPVASVASTSTVLVPVA